MAEKINLKGLSLKNIEEIFKNWNIERFRAKQVMNWIYKKGIEDFTKMTDLSKELRHFLKANACIAKIEILDKRISKNNDTVKFLFLLEDNNIIEAVLMKHLYGNSVCVSTQVGCKMGCKFCASTIGGFIRNLHSWEILDQVFQIRNSLKDVHITNIVIMGSGEPLDNYNEVLNFIRLANSPDIFNISFRRISLSTCGLVPEIRKLALEQLPITLSVSLHAPNDELRNRLMLINKRYPIDSLIKACKYYFKMTGRRITFEYALIKGINDSFENARELCDLLKGLQCHVNLIPINMVEGRGFVRPSAKRIYEFKRIIESNGIQTTIRKEKGSDIWGACGQLRNKFLDKKEGYKDLWRT